MSHWGCFHLRNGTWRNLSTWLAVKREVVTTQKNVKCHARAQLAWLYFLRKGKGAKAESLCSRSDEGLRRILSPRSTPKRHARASPLGRIVHGTGKS